MRDLVALLVGIAFAFGPIALLIYFNQRVFASQPKERASTYSFVAMIVCVALAYLIWDKWMPGGWRDIFIFGSDD